MEYEKALIHLNEANEALHHLLRVTEEVCATTMVTDHNEADEAKVRLAKQIATVSRQLKYDIEEAQRRSEVVGSLIGDYSKVFGLSLIPA